MTQTLTVTYFDGRHPLGAPATLLWGGREATLVNARVMERYALKALRVSPRVGTATASSPCPTAASCSAPTVRCSMPCRRRAARKARWPGWSASGAWRWSRWWR